MHKTTAPATALDPTPPDPLAEFLALVEQPFTKLVLSKPRTAAGDLVRVTVRPVVLKGEAITYASKSQRAGQ